MLDVEVAGHLEGADALRAVRPNGDGEQDVAVFHLPTGEDRAGCRRELLQAGGALEEATLALLAGFAIFHGARDAVGDGAATVMAERFAIILRIPNGDEGVLRFLLGHAGNALEIKRPCLCREKKMLRLTLQCVTFASDMVTNSKQGKRIRIKSDDI